MAPITLTRAQFAQSKAGQRPGATYERYLSFVNNARSAKLGAQAANPLAPSAAPDFGSLVGIAQKALGPSLTDAQILDRANTAVSGAMAPIRQGINDTFATRLGNVSHAITGYTNAAADALKSIPGADFSAAIRSRADAGAALGQFLRDQGAGAGDVVQARLAAIGAPAESHAMGAAATTGLANGNASALASGTLAGTDRLAAESRAASDYAASLPSLVQLAGMQNQRLAGAQNQAGLQSALATVAQKEPELALSLEQNLLGERTANNRQAISLASSMLNNYNSNELKKAITTAGLGLDYAKLASSNRNSAADRASREAIASADRQAAMARQIARDNSALDRTQITANSSAAKHLDSLSTSAFQKAASAAARMKAGTYGSSSSSAASLSAILGGGAPTAGSPYPYDRAYNAVYGMIEGTLGHAVTAAGLRKMTLRALAAGGYPVTVAKG